jgi:hypothetical protein
MEINGIDRDVCVNFVHPSMLETLRLYSIGIPLVVAWPPVCEQALMLYNVANAFQPYASSDG